MINGSPTNLDTGHAAYRYDAWGNPTSTLSTSTTLPLSTGLAANIASRQVLRYAAYCYDAESGLYYLSARSYEPATRQFISVDPGKADGEESAYQYCGGNPVANVDPSGLKPCIQRVVRTWRKYHRFPSWNGWATVCKAHLSNHNGIRLGNLIQHRETAVVYGIALQLITHGKGRLSTSTLVNGGSAIGITESLYHLGQRVKYYSTHAPPGLTIRVQKFLLVTPFFRMTLDGHAISYWWYPA